MGSGCFRTLVVEHKDKAQGCHAERRVPAVNPDSMILARIMIATPPLNMEDDRRSSPNHGIRFRHP